MLRVYANAEEAYNGMIDAILDWAAAAAQVIHSYKYRMKENERWKE